MNSSSAESVFAATPAAFGEYLKKPERSPLQRIAVSAAPFALVLTGALAAAVFMLWEQRPSPVPVPAPLPVPPTPVYDPLDIAYLGPIMLEAAGLPLSASQQERKRLMMACEGRYFGCEPRGQILAFHRELINSGLVRAP